MRLKAAVIALLLTSGASCALAAKACEELKAEIGKKLDEKGVKSYSLEIVDSGKEGDAKVVGSCEAGKKKIVYSRTTTPAGASPAVAPKN